MFLEAFCGNVEPISMIFVVEGEFMKDQDKVFIIIHVLGNLKRIRWDWDCSFAIHSRGLWGKCG